MSKESKLFLATVYLLLTYFMLHILVLGEFNALFQWRFGAYRLLLFLPFVAIAIHYANISGEAFWKLLICVSSFTLFWLALVILENEFERMEGLLSDPINRGNMALLYSIIALTASFAVTERSWKLAALIFFMSGVMLSAISGSRGGWPGLLVAFVLFFWFFSYYRLYRNLNTLFFSLASVCLFILFFSDELALVNRSEDIGQEIKGYIAGDIHTSIGYRLNLWKTAIYAIAEKPLLGWGWSQFDSAHQFLINAGKIEVTSLFGHPHNQFLLFLVETGFPGLVVFLLIFICPLWLAHQPRSNNPAPDQVYTTILITIICVYSLMIMMTDDPFSKKHFTLSFPLLILLALNNLRAANEGHSVNSQSEADPQEPSPNRSDNLNNSRHLNQKAKLEKKTYLINKTTLDNSHAANNKGNLVER